MLLNKDDNLNIHIETNGAIDIEPFKKNIKNNNISYIVDFKLPSSNMTNKMNLNNLNVVENMMFTSLL